MHARRRRLRRSSNEDASVEGGVAQSQRPDTTLISAVRPSAWRHNSTGWWADPGGTSASRKSLELAAQLRPLINWIRLGIVRRRAARGPSQRRERRGVGGRRSLVALRTQCDDACWCWCLALLSVTSVRLWYASSISSSAWRHAAAVIRIRRRPRLYIAAVLSPFFTAA